VDDRRDHRRDRLRHRSTGGVSVSGIMQGFLELVALTNDEWPYEVVIAAAWHHSELPDCRGYTTTTAGQARSAMFALLALGRVGQTLAIAQHVAEAYVEVELAGLEQRIHDVQLDGRGGFTYRLDVDLKQITFTHHIPLDGETECES
jgi:hypothetical protein